MTKKKKIILSIVAVVLALVTYGYFFGVQTGYVVKARMMRNPQLDVVPKPMSLDSCSEPATTLNTLDYSFSVPWSDCSQNITKNSNVFWVCSGSNVSVLCFSPRESLYNLLLPDVSSVRCFSPEERLCNLLFPDVSSENTLRQPMIKWLGLENAISTNFYICKKIWETTPKDISPFDSQLDALFKWTLLVLKEAMTSPQDIRGVSFFENGDIKGFQFGAPSIERAVRLSLFDQTDREILLIVAVSANSPVRLTQADINTIITTFSSKP